MQALASKSSQFVGARVGPVAPRGVVAERRNLTIVAGRRSAKIAARKGKSDAKKAKVYGKIGKLIVKAVKAGGPSANSNSQLKQVLDMAAQVNCPRDIIDRNISKASESKTDYSEVIYEAYGPGGTGFLIECLTDNLNRTAGDIRGLMSKVDGKMAEMGSVKFNFSRIGVIRIKAGVTEDQVFEAATEAGAEDIQPVDDEEGGFEVITTVETFGPVRAALEGMKLPINGEESGLVFRPNASVEVSDEALEKNQTMLDRLLALDDVDAVYSTCDGLDI